MKTGMALVRWLFVLVKKSKLPTLCCACIILFTIYDTLFSTKNSHNRQGGEIIKSIRALSHQSNRSNRGVNLLSDDDCHLPSVVEDGVPWPNCIEKIAWMKKSWKSSSCYADRGVDGSLCSIITYLSEIEGQCPSQNTRVPENYEELYFKGELVKERQSLQHILAEFSGVADLEWMMKRIQIMEKLWVDAAHVVFTTKLKRLKRVKKRIHLHLGLMKIGMGKSAQEGGPLGELVQWSDLIAALYVMGHELVITRTKAELIHLYAKSFNRAKPECPIDEKNLPFDLIYTDVIGYNQMSKMLTRFKKVQCRFRILDSFGTIQKFNVIAHSRGNPYGGLRLDLRQFNTMFPHTPDNTFLGFVVEKAGDNPLVNEGTEVKRDIALVYGKDEKFWKGYSQYLSIVNEYIPEIHGTVSKGSNVPSFVINHGVLPISELFKLLRRTKVFIGLGFPFEGPAPLEAIAMGAKFLNPRFNPPIDSRNHAFFKSKPTRRIITSQNSYAELYIGRPYVYTVDVTNVTELRSALSKITEDKNHAPFLPYEFSAQGMLERVAVLVEMQNLCRALPYIKDDNLNRTTKIDDARLWPPLRSLKVVTAIDITCNEACSLRGLICEPSFFNAVNRRKAFHENNLHCAQVKYSSVLRAEFPAYDEDSNTCFLQTNPLFFSCSESTNYYTRLCPCRDFIKGQVALCEHCIN